MHGAPVDVSGSFMHKMNAERQLKSALRLRHLHCRLKKENFALSAKSHLLRGKLFLFYTSAENDRSGNTELRSLKVKKCNFAVI